MKIIHVLPSIHEEAMGPSYSVPSLCRTLAERGLQVELHLLASMPSLKLGECRLQVHPWYPLLKKLGISPAMKKGLRGSASDAQIMHNHSLWMMPNVYPAMAVRGTGCRLVNSPRGTLSSWALNNSRWKKRIMWTLYQSDAIKATDLFHATSQGEYEDIRGMGFKAPVAVIPNGIEMPRLQNRRGDENQIKRLLFFGRLHPTKAVDVLLQAWRRVQELFPDWELDIVGPDQGGYLKRMKQLAITLDVKRVHFRGPLYGNDKSRMYQRADLFVLPTHSENFGMTVAEALAHGLPAVVSKGAPWQGLAEHRCGWWIEKGEGPLTECLREVLAMPREELREFGMRGRQWMQSDFAWPNIARMMEKTYQWLLGGGGPPEWVRT